MPWQLLAFVIAFVIAACISAFLATIAWRRWSIPGVGPFALLMLAVSVWSLTSALAHLSTTLPIKLFWTDVQYLGIVFVPPAWFVFALQYTGRSQWLSRRTLFLLAIHPIVTLALVWTNSFHHWFRQAVWLSQDSVFPLLVTNMGPAFWLHTVYSYLLLVWGTVFLVWQYLNASYFYQRQTAMLLLGASAPWIANFLFVFDLTPFPYLDLTPFGFMLTGISMAWGALRFKLFDVVPVARDAVVEGLRDAIIVLDVHDRVVDLNKAAERLLGYESQEIIGQSAYAVFSDYPDLQRHYDDMDDVYMELTLGSGDDRHIYELRISTLIDRHGRTKGRLVSFSDVTERMRVEWSLRKSEAALRQYAAELEAQNDELDAFAHTVAHDLKGPLGLLLGYSSLLEQAGDELPEESFRQSTHAIVQNTRKMGNIINELLLLASVRKMDEVDIAPLAMHVILDDVFERLADVLEKSEAVLHLPDVWPVALGYAPWVEEVWANYISNAIKYGGQPPHITLGALPDPHDADYVRFWVRDNGDGLTPEQQASLFAPFERLKQVRAKGHGLGLSIVRRIVEKLQGKVGVESDAIPGEGSTFYFSLPKA